MRPAATAAGLETCTPQAAPKGVPAASNLGLKRTKQEGRIPLHAVARTEFCYHSLQKDLPICTTAGFGLQPRGEARSSDFRDLVRIPKPEPVCKRGAPRKPRRGSFKAPGWYFYPYHSTRVSSSWRNKLQFAPKNFSRKTRSPGHPATSQHGMDNLLGDSFSATPGHEGREPRRLS